jgi:hypothetical protein
VFHGSFGAYSRIQLRHFKDLLTFHVLLGWAGTIVLCTVLMRASLFPLTVFADRNSRKVFMFVCVFGKRERDRDRKEGTEGGTDSVCVLCACALRECG